ncbi:hypothetical protein EST38_g5715 [Candolleomyces aberdarensis]|uniref:Cytochrome P450 n=1 Tax=Candolleomyces aberdarensis TaxID=2316362 RepID=A0A4Q2DJU6_9AGAR|nr:hypothetical protein EST38_g5715 [Candolleomyces aberdarensis]
MLYYLTRYPDWQDRVRKEVDELCEKVPGLGKRAVPGSDALADLKNLNAVINEMLRLQPPLPTMLQRAPVAGSGGKQLGNWFLPEGNSVQVPPFAVHRDPGYFSPLPKEFLPQRWFPEADSDPATVTQEFKGQLNVLDRSGFIPFSMGPANCAGKSMALKQLRYIPALLLRNFRFEFPEGYNPDLWEEELQDRFLMSKGKLPLRMVLRE